MPLSSIGGHMLITCTLKIQYSLEVHQFFHCLVWNLWRDCLNVMSYSCVPDHLSPLKVVYVRKSDATLRNNSISTLEDRSPLLGAGNCAEWRPFIDSLELRKIHCRAKKIYIYFPTRSFWLALIWTKNLARLCISSIPLVCTSSNFQIVDLSKHGTLTNLLLIKDLNNQSAPITFWFSSISIVLSIN